MDVKIIEELLHILVSPGATGSDSLENVFSTNIKNVAEKVNSSEKFKSVEEHLSSGKLCARNDVQWQFAQLNLCLIRLLQTVLEESVAENASANHDDEQVAEEIQRRTPMPSLPADALSISQQKTVTASLQFIVCFGMSPYLIPGVGLPLNRRCGYGGCVEAGIAIGRDEMDSRLLACTVTLLECVNSVSSRTLGEMIISRHLGDLLAALFQIHYTAARRDSAVHVSGTKDAGCTESGSLGMDCQGSFDRSQENVESLPQRDVDFCRKQLDTLLEKSSQPVLIQQLLILQNGPPPPSSTLKVEKVDKTPVWLRKLTRKSLVAAIMRPAGIQSLFAVLLQGDNEKSAEWKRYEDIARIVVDISLGASTSVENYYEKISPQILELIRMNGKQGLAGNDVRVTHRRHCVRAAVQMVSLMMSRQQRLTEKFLMNVLLSPLLQCLEKTEGIGVSTPGAGSSCIVVEEDVLTSCIEDIRTLSTGPDGSLAALLCPVLGVLFPLYHHVRQSVTHLRGRVEEIMQWIFRHIDLQTALDFLSQFCLEMGTDCDDRLINRMSDNLKFSSGESGGLSVVRKVPKKVTLDISGLDSLTESVVHLIVSSKRQDDIGAELFLLCLKSLSDIVSDEVDSAGNDVVIDHLGRRGRDGVFGSSYLDSEDGEMSEEEGRIRRNLIVITLLTKMCEKIGPSCMNKSTHILGFVEATLTRGVKILENTSDALFGAFEMETLSMALGLLTSLFADKEKLSGLNWHQMQDFIPLLQKLSDSALDPSLQEMALDLRIAIATHGLVRFGSEESPSATVVGGKESNGKEKREAEKDDGACTDSSRVPESCLSTNVKKKKSPLIEVLNSTEVSESPVAESDLATSSPALTTKDIPSHQDMAAEDTPFDQQMAAAGVPSYQQMAALVCSSSVPERGYALVVLRRLIERKDAETLANGENILKICFLNLVHPDTYIYLATIQVVVALAHRYPQMVIPQLAERYATTSEAEKGSPELRMKLGEVLVKVSSGLGDMVPHYRDLLLGSVLSAARDPDELVRASAMSNLAEICRLLRFSLGNVIHEIFACVRNLLKYDDSVEVRRGAAMFTTLLLHGLSKDMFKVLESLSVEFLRLIKDVLKYDKDDCVRHHAQASFEALEAIVQDFLTPSQRMEKHIRFP